MICNGTCYCQAQAQAQKPRLTFLNWMGGDQYSVMRLRPRKLTSKKDRDFLISKIGIRHGEDRESLYIPSLFFPNKLRYICNALYWGKITLNTYIWKNLHIFWLWKCFINLIMLFQVIWSHLWISWFCVDWIKSPARIRIPYICMDIHKQIKVR